MAYTVSNNYRNIVYSGEALYDCKLKINNVQVPNKQIQTIKISSPIIDTTADTGGMFHIGTFISQSLEIKFKNLDGLDLTNNPEIDLEIGLYVGNSYEYVPIGKYLIDELAENYQTTCTITCMDYGVKFKSELDISQFFNERELLPIDTTKTTQNRLIFVCEGTESGNYYLTYNSTSYYFTMPNNIQEDDELIFNTQDRTLSLNDTTQITLSTTTVSGATILNFQEEIKFIYASDLFEAICGYYNVNVGTYPEVNNDKKIYYYDSTLTGKQYVMYLAELFGGNAKIERNGYCSVIPLKNYTNIEINALTSRKFEVGDTYELTRVCYDNGKVKYQVGGNVVSVEELPTENIDIATYYYLTSDMKYYRYVMGEQEEYEWQEDDDIKNTLYLRSDNIFITQEGDVSNIAVAVQGFSITNITCENRMDLSLDSWDIIKYTLDNNREYYTYYDNVTTFNGVAMGKVQVNIPLKITEETTNIITNSTEEKNRYIKTVIDELNNSLTTTVSEVNSNINKVNQRVDTVDGTVQTIVDSSSSLAERLAAIETSIDGLRTNLIAKGGNNLFYYAKEFWTNGTTGSSNQAKMKEYTDTELKQLAVSQKGYIFNNGVSEQVVSVKNNDFYTISFSYKVLNPLANITVSINGVVTELTATEWTDFVTAVNITTNTIDFKITTDSNNSLEMYDLLATLGKEVNENNELIKQTWTQNPNETRTDTVTIGKGIQVNSSTTQTYTRIDADGNRIYDKNNNVITEFTDKGIETDSVESDVAEIGGIFIQQIDNQTWITSLLS